MTQSSSNNRWLSILGIGEEGEEGLSVAARRILSEARFIIGGKRHLAMLKRASAETMVWPTPFERGVEEVKARRGSPVCVLASGDPFLYGVGPILSAAIPPEEMTCLPAASSLSVAAARLGWALQDCVIVALHGRPFEGIIPHLRPSARLLVLSWDEATPEKLARLLVTRGLGTSRVTVLEALGGVREKLTSIRAEQFHSWSVDPLNVTAIEVEGHTTGSYIPLTPGLADDWFETDGQLTKREARAIALSSLAPWPGAKLWDVGAGSGSVSIEWMLAHPRNRAWAVERSEDRAGRIARNAAALGVPDLAVAIGEAPAVLAELPPPDAIFIGGGGRDVVDAAWAYLPVGRRLVVNAVTLETQGLVVEGQTKHGGDLLCIEIARADAVGRFRAWRPMMPIVQWSVVKR